MIALCSIISVYITSYIFVHLYTYLTNRLIITRVTIKKSKYSNKSSFSKLINMYEENRILD